MPLVVPPAHRLDEGTVTYGPSDAETSGGDIGALVQNVLSGKPTTHGMPQYDTPSGGGKAPGAVMEWSDYVKSKGR